MSVDVFREIFHYSFSWENVFSNLCGKGRHRPVLFWEIKAYEQHIQVSLTNLQVFFWGHCFNILIQMYFSEEWEQIYQLSKHNNRSEFSCHKFSSNLIWINSPISLCYLHREKLPCDSLLNMKVIWICYFLFNLHKFMSGYLYFPNILKDRKDHV